MIGRVIAIGSLVFAALAAFLYLGPASAPPPPAPAAATATTETPTPQRRLRSIERQPEPMDRRVEPGPALDADPLEPPAPPSWATIEGRVVDNTASATSRGRVVAWIAGKKQVTRPDERGHFRYHQPGGPVRIRAEAESEDGPLASDWVSLDASDGGSWNLTLSLQPAD